MTTYSYYLQLLLTVTYSYYYTLVVKGAVRLEGWLVGTRSHRCDLRLYRTQMAHLGSEKWVVGIR